MKDLYTKKKLDKRTKENQILKVTTSSEKQIQRKHSPKEIQRIGQIKYMKLQNFSTTEYRVTK